MSPGTKSLAITACIVSLCFAGLTHAASYDYVLRGGTVFDGSGAEAIRTDVAILDDRIAAIGDIAKGSGTQELDVTGLAVAPGFINMLSWAADTLLHDGRSLGDIHQGVTLEVFGEGSSEGPMTPTMREVVLANQGDIKFDIPWTTLGEFLDHLVAKGVSPNVASFVGATTVRLHELGFDDRPPSPAELETMQELVRKAMREGAMGVGSSLIYAPGFYAQTDELVALMEAAAEYGGMYISHMRSEGNRILPAIDELVHIAEATRARAEIYHLKLAGRSNWSKFDQVIDRIEQARARGLSITANMYTYTAGSTGLDAAMPPWVQEGGYAAWSGRLRDPEIRERILTEMQTPTDSWENLLLAAGPDQTLLVGFRNPDLRKYTGKTLLEVADERERSPYDTAVDLVIEDGSRVQVIYFLMQEEQVSRLVQLPWMSFGSDAGSMAPEGLFLNKSTHPRAYGNFARLFGRYVREEKVLPLRTAIHKLTKLPATNLRLRERGELKEGFYADVVAFDPATIRDHATYEKPHQLSTGMAHVFVNGTLVLIDGEHTGALPGRVVRGPGWRGWTRPVND
jgi:N-acyl-D-amino-acid deacylase